MSLVYSWSHVSPSVRTYFGFRHKCFLLRIWSHHIFNCGRIISCLRVHHPLMHLWILRLLYLIIFLIVFTRVKLYIVLLIVLYKHLKSSMSLVYSWSHVSPPVRAYFGFRHECFLLRIGAHHISSVVETSVFLECILRWCISDFTACFIS